MRNEDIRDTMIWNEIILKNQNVELTRQIKTLEVYRLKLVKQLMCNASQMGKIGIIFLELSVLGGNDVGRSNNSSDLANMRQVLKGIHN